MILPPSLSNGRNCFPNNVHVDGKDLHPELQQSSGQTACTAKIEQTKFYIHRVYDIKINDVLP